MWQQLIASPLGYLEAQWSDEGLYGLSFRGHSYIEAEHPESSQQELTRAQRKSSVRLQRALDEYFDSAELPWSLDELDWSGVSTFHRKVLELCHAIPIGETLTYGQLARAAGSPQAARAVGGAMARNRWPLIIPCHRVVGSTGKLTGYSGEGGTKTKHWLLEHELHASRGHLFSTLAR